MSFGENLQYLRDRAGYTQEALAEKLEVTRQSVSKWESGGSFPEMDKIIALCDLFHVDMDTLLRGDVVESFSLDRAGYDKHYNWFSKMIAGATMLILLGISAMMLMISVGVSETVGTAFFLLTVAIAVVMYIVSGMSHEAFEKKNPMVADFYTEEEKERNRRKSITLISCGVAAIVLGVAWMVLFGDLMDHEILSLRMIGVFMLIVAVAVGALIYGGIQSDKCNVEKWNNEHDQKPERVKLRHKVNVACGCIMLSATIIFLAIGFYPMVAVGDYASGWAWGWVVYPIAGVLCGIVSMIMTRNDPDFEQ